MSAPARAASEDAAIQRQELARAREPSEIGARHMLAMHVQSKSRPESVTRSREEARALAQQCLMKLRSGARFEDLVAGCSDEPGAGERGGELGVFRREVMVKPFADAAFQLRVGEISELVETPYGFHIIQRTK